MKVRFAEQAMRCRVTRLELQRLLSGAAVALGVALPRKHCFSLSVRAAAAIGQWQLDSDPTGLWLAIPRDELQALAQALPSRAGIEHVFELPPDESAGVARLLVSFEVDLKEGARRPRTAAG